jgi:MoaA/NifB/PqqE/SkfB family radical SAM enzyme
MQSAHHSNSSMLRSVKFKLLSIRRGWSKRSNITTLDPGKIISWFTDMGGVYKIVFGGGEPFLSPGFVSVCEAVTQNHFVSLNTNFVLPAVSEFAGRIDPSRVVFVNASLHIDQLEKRKLMGKYIDNYHLYKSKGFPVGASVVAYPALRDKIRKYREDFRRQGIDFQCNYFFGWYKNRWYPDAYTKEDIGLYQLDENMLKDPPRICNAGYNVCSLDMDNNIRVCSSTKHVIGSLYSRINWSDKLVNCNIKYCSCTVYVYENELFNAAAAR